MTRFPGNIPDLAVRPTTSLPIALVLLITLTLVTAFPNEARAQMRRSASGGPPAESPPGAPIRPRVPYAGSWEGTRVMNDGPAANQRDAISMTFDADSAGKQYSGFAILPGNVRAPHRKVVMADGALTWEQPNSGGGVWVYSARLVGRDSIAGTLVLRGAPWGGTPHTGAFALVRRRMVSR